MYNGFIPTLQLSFPRFAATTTTTMRKMTTETTTIPTSTTIMTTEVPRNVGLAQNGSAEEAIGK